MKLVRFATSCFVIVLTLMAVVRVVSAMMVYDNARILLVEPCPIYRPVEGGCVVNGSIGHALVTGDAEITLKDGEKLVVPDASVRSIVYAQQNVRFEPFGKIICGVIGFGILLFGGLVAFSVMGYRPASSVEK